MVTLDGKQIREVTPQGITYFDDNGEEKFIDFAACYENYIKHTTTPEHWEDFKKLNNKTDADWEWYVEWRKSHRHVGIRDIPGWPDESNSYMEFYTEPPIRFTFTIRDDYERVVYIMRRAKWHMSNLT